MDIEQLKKLLRSYNLKPNFTYGQNFLIDDFVLQDIVDAAEVSSQDAVLEIGPGIGNLTRLLCERAGFVLSVEKDPKFFPVLKSVKKDYPKNFRFEIADALEFDYVKGLRDQGRGKIGQDHPSPLTPLPYKVVANIPYFITGKILKMLMTSKNKPTSITILTQKEVAQNIVAGPGRLSILAISVQLFGQPKIIQTVPAKSFYPAPKVDSAVVKIDLFKKSKYILRDEKEFFKIVKACFAGKRKQIHNTLVNNLGLEKEKVLEILLELKIKPEARPQELTIQEWILLAESIS
jgi:16S rRNA (adenine1518-N6/adenine1519-N6)-dimethyltransferase